MSLSRELSLWVGEGLWLQEPALTIRKRERKLPQAKGWRRYAAEILGCSVAVSEELLSDGIW